MSRGVSLCMIVRNEERRLPRCLSSVADLVHEIVIVDTGSTDATRQVAAQFGARVVEFAWRDDFAAARNESIRHATSPWIFWLDADHWLDETNRQRLGRLFASLPDENVGYLMQWHSPSEEGGAQATVLDATQLFRNDPRIRWQYRIHEQIRPAILRSGGSTRRSDVVIYHTGYQDPREKHAKLQRNLRLLLLENQEHPGDALTLFHLGWTYWQLGQPQQAWQPLCESLRRAPPGEAIVRKLFALLVRCARQMGRRPEAFQVCLQGRIQYPDDPELLFHEGQLRREAGDLAGAEQALVRLLTLPPPTYIAASVDPGLTGYKGRCALAEVYRDAGRLAEAEAQWRRAVAEAPHFKIIWLMLGDMWLVYGRWEELRRLVDQLQADPETALEAALLEARMKMQQRQFAEARQLLGAAAARWPQSPLPLELMARTLLLEGQDPGALEQTLAELLALDPTNDFALQQRAQRAAAAAASPTTRAPPPDDPFAPILVGHW
jgi:tetratricopeptide (TPR) repeat protein